MYSGQLLEMLLQSVHSQRLADSERKWWTSEQIDAHSIGLAPFADTLRRQLPHRSSGAGQAVAARSPHPPVILRLASPPRAVMWLCLLLIVMVASLAVQFAAEKVTTAQARCGDIYRVVDANVLVCMTTEELEYLAATSCPSDSEPSTDS